MYDQSIVPRATDGYHHPASEDDVIALVRHAVAHRLQIRVRGASHSTAWSIFTDPVDGFPANHTLACDPPPGPNLDLVMDRMIDLVWIDEVKGIVEVGAGIHLGPDPYNPIGPSTPENSLLYQIYEKGWAVNDLGGITHQTVSGFSATGSAGGSLIYDFDNIVAFRVVDGRGDAAWIEQGDPIFDAMRVSVGLLGIVVRVRLQLVPMFDIYGQELTVQIDDPACPIDLTGPGDATRPSMAHFLTETPYSRVLWWPQRGAERLVIWQAIRQDSGKPSTIIPVPYQEFTPDLGGWVEQLLGYVFYTLLGNHGFAATVPKLRRGYARFAHCVARMWAGRLGRPVAVFLANAIAGLIGVLLAIPTLVFLLAPGLLARLFPTALNIFQPISKPGRPTLFQDHYWRSLCMDNTADDILMGTEFTEIWVPIGRTEQCMKLLDAMFRQRGTQAIGWFSTEVYSSTPSKAWLSPAYSDGGDEWRNGVARFDVFWFRGNAGEPQAAEGFFRQYWDLFRDAGVPFRFHWGKFVPSYDFPIWAEHYLQTLPRLNDFLALRAERDPQGVFFTGYWRERLTGRA
ncbi:D-arabinono-1,4-lactone oxidase [Sphingomonas sp. 2R-10]|uniref:D-arabinono-1,4-lactone oxidase n=1 Tax=Sphingomonas sp. 2R-10 TaxID=3045148 RepID=UPI000F78B671|nr:D-arabinono-1,4-lactone oxidase [Sphingomonas sp. 2R-10]MDJ0277697.1 D-arabinono-1,4-lactone oxidase [Sphingomonas sp. 2R-10]